MRHPEIYPTFLDFSGESHPTLGDRARTLNPAFGGDQAAFDRVDPLTILRSRRFPDSEGVIATGGDDREYGPQVVEVTAATRAAAMTIAVLQLPGGQTPPSRCPRHCPGSADGPESSTPPDHPAKTAGWWRSSRRTGTAAHQPGRDRSSRPALRVPPDDRGSG